MASLSSALQPLSSALLRCPSSQGSLRSNGVSLSFGRLQSSGRRLRIFCEAKPETVDKVIKIVTKQLAIKEGSVKAESKFEDLGADSLDQVEIVMALEEEFKINVDENGAEAISTVQDAAELIEKAVSKAV
ncbi:hypothetical protein GOP47_0019074 [Adiantum capillus-veneris]|uniref:Acyl carrier protein n=1 Tax=Adiantum capillus-veneris TaxID=13818 RepID=A0A9D4UEQ3_ADICA|nr:hypothetical protein GOP47_0019074 [Adiantum capillus-veneris]